MNKEILTKKEIKKYNKLIKNINNIKYIDNYTGIIINRANLKSKPDNESYQETELYIGTIFNILAIDITNKWYYIKIYNYVGFVNINDTVLFNNISEYNLFNNNQFVIFINKYNNIDISTKLPYLYHNCNYYYVIFPKKYNNTLEYNLIKIDKYYIHNNYLPYTYNNFLKISFNYLDTPYSYGGLNYGLDCSSLVCNIFKCFGFYLPRNTIEQEYNISNYIDLTKYNNIDKIKIINNLTYPSLLYMKNHVMISIPNNKILHAYGKTKKVVISDISILIDKITTIHSIH